MSIFSDLLYPDNPKRREEVRSKTAEARNAFLGFNTNWNNFSDSFNTMVNQVINQEQLPFDGKFRLQQVALDPDKQTVDEMVTKINAVIEDAKQHIYQFNESVKTTLDTSKANEYEKLTNYDNIGTAEKWVGWAIPTGVGVSISVYLGVAMARGISALAASGITVSLGLKFVGGLSIGILSAVGFVVTDLIIGAITGATEREKLNTANQQLDEMMSKVIHPLNQINIEIAGQTSQINIGKYWIAENMLLIRRSDTTWESFTLPEVVRTSVTSNAYLKLVS
ncbi:hypothetical protein [Vibrio bathopelagicus]